MSSTIVTKLKLETEGFKKGIADSKDAAKDLSSTMAVVGGAAGAAAAAIIAMGVSSVDTLSELNKMGKELNSSAEGLWQIRHAAAQSGQTLDEMSEGMEELNGKIKEAAGGNADLIELFSKFGITQQELSTLKTDEVLMRLAKAGITGADAIALLGEKGASLYPVLQELAKGNLIDASGMKEAAEGAAEVKKAIDEVHTSITMAFGKALVEALPYVRTFCTTVRDEYASLVKDVSAGITVLGANIQSWLGNKDLAQQMIKDLKRDITEEQKPKSKDTTATPQAAQSATQNATQQTAYVEQIKHEKEVANIQKQINEAKTKASQQQLTEEQKLRVLFNERCDLEIELLDIKKQQGETSRAYQDKEKEVLHAILAEEQQRAAVKKKSADDAAKHESEQRKRSETYQQSRGEFEAQKKKDLSEEMISDAKELAKLEEQLNEIRARENTDAEKDNLTQNMQEQLNKEKEIHNLKMEMRRKERDAQKEVDKARDALNESQNKTYNIGDIAQSGGQLGFEARMVQKYDAEAKRNVGRETGRQAERRAESYRQRLRGKGVLAKDPFKQALKDAEDKLEAIKSNTDNLGAVKASETGTSTA